jgi:hypothetical protein
VRQELELPFKQSTMTELLAFSVGCSRGPITRDGQSDTTSSPDLSAWSNASSSDSVLDRQYQFWQSEGWRQKSKLEFSHD